jgi:hypothetical protein
VWKKYSWKAARLPDCPCPPESRCSRSPPATKYWCPCSASSTSR